MENLSFEAIRGQINRLPIPQLDTERELFWVANDRLGVAKTKIEAFEIFFIGDKIKASSAIVRQHMDYGTWEGKNSQQYIANRIMLSNEPHFLALSALIAHECLREGISDVSVDIAKVFKKVEPIIELALEKKESANKLIFGLLGELILLERLLLAVDKFPELRKNVLDMWFGYLPYSRDFVVGKNAIEVKTTSGYESSHFIHGLNQIEPRSITNGDLEEDVYILSFGLTAVAGAPYSIARQKETILKLLGEESLAVTETPLQKRFLECLHGYGEISEINVLDQLSSFAATYSFTFPPRLYKITTPNVPLIRQAELAGTFVNPSHIEYLVDFPATITPDNPARDWVLEASLMAKDALGLSRI